MAGLNDDGQWIILMALLVCIGLFFIAVVVNESTLVGRTTAESVLDFSKGDIVDIRSEVLEWMDHNAYKSGDLDNLNQDVQKIALQRLNAQVRVDAASSSKYSLHYNDGVTNYSVNITRI